MGRALLPYDRSGTRKDGLHWQGPGPHCRAVERHVVCEASVIDQDRCPAEPRLTQLDSRLGGTGISYARSNREGTASAVQSLRTHLYHSRKGHSISQGNNPLADAYAHCPHSTRSSTIRLTHAYKRSVCVICRAFADGLVQNAKPDIAREDGRKRIA